MYVCMNINIHTSANIIVINNNILTTIDLISDDL